MSDKTWRKRALVVAAGVGVSAVVLAGCTSPGGTDGGNESSEEVTDTQIILAETNEVTSFNDATPQSNLDINGKLDYVTHEDFSYVNDQMEVVPNDRVRHHGEGLRRPADRRVHAERRTCSGPTATPIDTDDLLLGWAVASGYFDDATFDEEGAVTAGTQYFTIAGSTVGVNGTEVPEVSEDKKKLTLVYDTPYVDWNHLSSCVSRADPRRRREGRRHAGGARRGDPDHPARRPRRTRRAQRDDQGRRRLLEHRLRRHVASR